MPARWTRREEADFYRVVSTFGVVFDTKLQKFDWSQFRAFARLDKKTDESLEKYYYSFIAMCKRVCRMQAKAETGKRRRRLSASPSVYIGAFSSCVLCENVQPSGWDVHNSNARVLAPMFHSRKSLAMKVPVDFVIRFGQTHSAAMR